VGVERNEVDASGAATGTKITPDLPPPGAGLTTSTEPRPTAATNASGTEPVSSVELKNVVLKDVPFQTIVEADANPVPLTMSVTPVDSGFMLTGETISTNGTGLLGPLTLGVKGELNAITATGRRKPALKQRATKRILLANDQSRKQKRF
jgi:hypothetical protein